MRESPIGPLPCKTTRLRVGCHFFLGGERLPGTRRWGQCLSEYALVLHSAHRFVPRTRLQGHDPKDVVDRGQTRWFHFQDGMVLNTRPNYLDRQIFSVTDGISHVSINVLGGGGRERWL